jgi:hypothetical protein
MNEIQTSNPNIYFKAPYERLVHLTGANYKTKRQYLWKQGWPHHLYKYKPCNIQHLRSFIVDSLLYLSARSELNDPFDVKSVLHFTKETLHPPSYYKQLSKDQGLTHSKRKEIKNRLSSPEKIKNAIQSHLYKAIEGTGFHSFTKRHRDLLMWSHYADGHRGVCMVFSTAHDIDTFINALPVSYQQSLPVIEYSQNIGGDLVKKAFLTKAKPWKYEDERRIFCPKLAKKFLYFDPASLVGLIFGANISTENEAAIRGLVDERVAKGLPTLKIYRAFQSENEYRLRIQIC